MKLVGDHRKNFREIDLALKSWIWT